MLFLLGIMIRQEASMDMHMEAGAYVETVDFSNHESQPICGRFEGHQVQAIRGIPQGKAQRKTIFRCWETSQAIRKPGSDLFSMLRSSFDRASTSLHGQGVFRRVGHQDGSGMLYKMVETDYCYPLIEAAFPDSAQGTKSQGEILRIETTDEWRAFMLRRAAQILVSAMGEHAAKHGASLELVEAAPTWFSVKLLRPNGEMAGYQFGWRRFVDGDPCLGLSAAPDSPSVVFNGFNLPDPFLMFAVIWATKP